MNPTASPSAIKVATVVGSVSRRAGGMFDAVRLLCQTLAERENVAMEILSLRDDQTDRDLSAWQPLKPRAFPPAGPRVLGHSPAVVKALEESRPDIIHSHGLWQLLSHSVNRHGRRRNTPVLISPHGMLDPWAIRNSSWKKRLAGLFFENRNLREAGCLHALCRAEAEAIRAFGLNNPVCVIPNGIILADEANEPPPPAPPWENLYPAGTPVLLYLGRLHPKKGLPNLLSAWARQSPGDWRLVVAGWDQGNHENELKQLAADLGIGGTVHFPGPQFDEARDACYRNAAAFVLPSLSEGLPVVVLEAWARRLPVLITPTCNLPEGTDAGAAIGISCETDGIAKGVGELFAMSAADRTAMGAKGRSLVETRFTWSIIARRMRETHDRLLAGELRAGDCVEWSEPK